MTSDIFTLSANSSRARQISTNDQTVFPCADNAIGAGECGLRDCRYMCILSP